jgi:hypothetical protein
MSFELKSGNVTPFKMMGSSSAKDTDAKTSTSKKGEKLKWTEISREKVAPGSSAAEKGYTWAITMQNNKGAGTKVVYQ